MPKVTCTSCNRKIKVPQCIVAVVIRCPACSRLFHTTVPEPFSPASQSAEAAPCIEEPEPPRAPPPLLVPFHQCHHCGSAIHQPIGQRAATILCPACIYKTSLYAVHHDCPACGRLLESPAAAADETVTCPACKGSVRIPKDVLLKDAPAGSDEFWFGLDCPSCRRDVVAREEDVGSYAVCPHCLVPFEVPGAGHYLNGCKPAPPAPRQVVKEATCPRCFTRFTRGLSACPVCASVPAQETRW